MAGTATELQRIEDFISRLTARVSKRVLDWMGGVAFLNDDLSKIWDVNFLDLHETALSAEEIADEAEGIFSAAGCDHRRVRVLDPVAGAALEPSFTELGWETDVHVVMAHRRLPNRVVDTSAVREIGAATWPGREEQMRSYAFANDEETLRQMRVFYDLLVNAAAGRDFGIVEEGRAVSFALLYSDGSIGQIEDVATLEPYRNRGYSWQVVMKALEESKATHDLTFLIADDRDWPKSFYTKVGFDPVARHHYFLKKPPDAERPT